MRRLYEAFRRVNRTARPEGSVVLRGAVLATVMIAVVAVAISGAAAAGDAIAALVLLPVGAWVSHRRRAADNTWIKVALTVGAALALARFFGDIRTATTIEDTRLPLTGLFLALQILHGFDLPQRRDLGFTLASSLALIGLAAVNTHAGLFGVTLVLYAAMAGVSLAAMQRSAAAERADEIADEMPDARRLAGGTADELEQLREGVSGEPRRVAAAAGRAGAGLVRASGPVVLVGMLVFLLLPRTDAGTLGTLPFRGLPGPRLPSSLVQNSGLAGDGQSTPGERGGSPLPFNPTAYFGFSEYVDLRTVGELSGEPVMRVRADMPRFWRGMVFDTYDGLGWTRSQDEPPQPTHGLPVSFRPQLGPDELAGGPLPDSDTRRITQTFELLDATPNLIFAAAEARRIFIAGGSASRWEDGTISTGAEMEEETIYSVVSEVITTDPAALRTRTGTPPDDLRNRYTQLPEDLPERVRDLSARLTDGLTTNYRKAEAVEAWLGEHTAYTLDAPPPPRNGDMVDHFLFESRQGWCEPIASSMVVLLRAAGVPARFATGFQPGDHNPITNVWDVEMSDAHAWTEVWIPHEGWVQFDPTGAVPEAVDGGGVSTIPLLELAQRAGALVPEPVLGAARELGAAAWSPAGGVLAALAGAGALALVRVRRRRDEPDPVTGYERLTTILERHGIAPDPWQTPREYVERVRLRAPDVPPEALRTLLTAEEARRYARSGPPAEPAPPDAPEERALADVTAALEAEQRQAEQRDRAPAR